MRGVFTLRVCPGPGHVHRSLVINLPDPVNLMRLGTILVTSRQVASFAASLLFIVAAFAPLQEGCAQRSERALTRQDVRDYIRLRIETHQLQQKMKANADQYGDVIQAFFKRRAALLKKEGRAPDAFDALQKRIMRAEKALEMVADSAEYRTQLQNNRKAVEMSEHYSEAEKEEALAQYARQDSIRQARHIDPTRRDWPAVRPYEDALEHLVDYAALNRSDPPDLDTLPAAKN